MVNVSREMWMHVVMLGRMTVWHLFPFFFFCTWSICFPEFFVQCSLSLVVSASEATLLFPLPVCINSRPPPPVVDWPWGGLLIFSRRVVVVPFISRSRPLFFLASHFSLSGKVAVQQELSPSVLAVVSVDGVVVCCRSFVVVFSRFNCFLFLFFFSFRTPWLMRAVRVRSCTGHFCSF